MRSIQRILRVIFFNLRLEKGGLFSFTRTRFLSLPDRGEMEYSPLASFLLSSSSVRRLLSSLSSSMVFRRILQS